MRQERKMPGLKILGATAMTDDKAVPDELNIKLLIEIMDEDTDGLCKTIDGKSYNLITNSQLVKIIKRYVDTEYILKSLHLKIKNDWFARGLKAGKISKNTSGCCCVIEDDGETISSLCGAHKALVDEAYNEGLDEGIKDDRIQGGE